MIKVRFYTDSFRKKLEEFVEDQLGNQVGFKRAINKTLIWDQIFWEHNKEEPSDFLPDDLKRPDIIEATVEDRTEAFQSQPRIFWGGYVVKVDDIPEIYSYKVE